MKGADSKTCEEWKAVAGYEGLYEVSNFGRVRKGPTTGKGCVPFKILAQAIRGKRNSYPYLTLTKSNHHKKFYVHRLVALAFVPQIAGKPITNHKDGNKQNPRATNLEWSSLSDNLAHAYRSCLRRTRLTERKVRQIRRLSATLSQHALARKFHVDRKNINLILARRIWTHV